jgi:signal transduction histidine kinase
LKFHKPGQSPTVKVSAQERPSVADSPRSMARNGRPPRAFEIRFEDDGIGFDPKYLDRIFNVFQRLHGRNEYEGTGMGLAICRKIVERHHGQITAQSQPGRGATFILTLPAEQPTEGDPTREPVAQANHDSNGG